MSQKEIEDYGCPSDIIWAAKLKAEEVRANGGVPLPLPTQNQLDNAVIPEAKVKSVPADDVPHAYFQGKSDYQFRTIEEQKYAEKLYQLSLKIQDKMIIGLNTYAPNGTLEPVPLDEITNQAMPDILDFPPRYVTKGAPNSERRKCHNMAGTQTLPQAVNRPVDLRQAWHQTCLEEI